MLAIVPLKILVRLRIVLPELSDDILADIAEILLDLARHPELILRRNGRHLPSFPHQIQDKLRDVAAGDGYMLDCASDDVSLRAGDNVCNTIPRVNDGPSQRAIGDSIGAPGRGEGENSLYGNIQPLDVERLEEYLRRLFSILGRVEGRFSLPRCSVRYVTEENNRVCVCVCDAPKGNSGLPVQP